MFLLIVGLLVPVVGTFDDRIYAPRTASRGLPLFGAVPRFPGDEAGSYRERVLTRDV